MSEHVVWAIGQPVALPAVEQQEETQIGPEAIIAARKLLFGCSRCPNRWNGKKTAHCSSCHNTFSGPGAFDQHRSAGVCCSQRGMAARGLEQQERADYAVWGYADRDSRWENTENEDDEE